RSRWRRAAAHRSRRQECPATAGFALPPAYEPTAVLRLCCRTPSSGRAGQSIPPRGTKSDGTGIARREPKSSARMARWPQHDIDRGGVELPLTGRVGKNVLPRPALPCRQHTSQLLSCGFVAVHRAAVERASPSRRAAPRAMELELQDASQKVAHVWHVGRNMIFRTGIEILLSPNGGLH